MAYHLGLRLYRWGLVQSLHRRFVVRWAVVGQQIHLFRVHPFRPDYQTDCNHQRMPNELFLVDHDGFYRL